MKKQKNKLITYTLLVISFLLGSVPVFAGGDWTQKQDQAHQIAVIARSMSLPETSPIIVEASRIWWEEEQKKIEQEEAELMSFLNEHYADAVDMAGTMYAEARGLDKREMSMVSWCILNRWDTQRFGSTLSSVIWAKSQFAHSTRAVSDDGTDLVWLAQDVLTRWYREQQGEQNVGRTLPQGYCYYYGNGKHNLFRVSNSGKGAYEFGLWNPYS